ncbi:hypothetical protein HK414_07915 [Ramlibacter terrae]|uniref:Uncharacterized protein n=1 Tax=Ramlibacter terrae TaxID=2732511 RepID=A0ABX6P1I8_9BURK|nr:hypothetical protein HK414_07915 [Ramlibacter terrae]
MRLEAELAGKGAGDVRDLLVQGKEAAASGHLRDAETAFMMACRAAGKLSGTDVLLADAMYRLGSHYAAVEGAAPEGKRGEIRERARSLYATSRKPIAPVRQRPRAHPLRRERLATLGGSASDAKMVAAATPKPAPEPASAKPAPEVKKAPPPAPAVVRAPPPAPAVVTAPKPAPAVVAAPKPAPPPVVAQPAPRPAETVATTTRRARPSFDCDKARSTREDHLRRRRPRPPGP